MSAILLCIAISPASAVQAAGNVCAYVGSDLSVHKPARFIRQCAFTVPETIARHVLFQIIRTPVPFSVIIIFYRNLVVFNYAPYVFVQIRLKVSEIDRIAVEYDIVACAPDQFHDRKQHYIGRVPLHIMILTHHLRQI